jgi:cyclic pyranopterin phosphate synthase
MRNAVSILPNSFIKDDLGRSFSKLRISLTNTCNLACTYCVSDKKEKLDKSVSNSKFLTNIEYIGVVKSLLNHVPINTIRLTGGEPLLYRDIVALVSGIKNVGVEKIKMTTNGSLLKSLVQSLYKAGLNSINISLDAMEEESFYKISRRRNLKSILDGIDKALDLGISVKINSVIMKGVNEDQILPLLNYAGERKISIRFLELMSMGHMAYEHDKYFYSENEILNKIAKEHVCFPIEREKSATANYWITEQLQEFGVISNISHPFCSDCDRLRLDSYGNIFGCLSSNESISVMDCLNDDEEMKKRLVVALGQKQNAFKGSSMSMKSIGG